MGLQSLGLRPCFGKIIDDRLNAERGWIRNGRHKPLAVFIIVLFIKDVSCMRAYFFNVLRASSFLF